MIEVEKVEPNGLFTNYVFKAIPLAFDESMSYYECLCGLLNYMKNTMIPALNNNADAVIEVQNLMNQLQEFVDNYFDNLDVQEEINNKLDEMVTDGTLQSLIDNYCEPILQELTNEVNEATDNVNRLAENVGTLIDEYRKEYYNRYHIFNLPNEMSNNWFKNIKIYESQDKKNYQYKIDIESLKNRGGSTYYVDNTYTGSSDGSQNAPFKTLQAAFSNTSDGDTIIVKKNIYHRSDLPTTNTQTKNNVNIICEEGTFFTTSDALTWSTNETYSNVYQATRSGVTNVIDIRNYEKDTFVRFTKVSALSECANRIGSYYTDGTTVYINNGSEVNNNNTIVSLSLGYMALNFEATSKNMHIYMENAICINSSVPVARAVGNSNYDCEIICNNCKFLFLEQSDARDGFSSLGAKTIFINCEASSNGKDGFNYHANDGKLCYAIEINCKANSNGLNRTNPHTYNGSTAHDGCQVIRINCVYNNNNGSNVADVQTDTISVNINCKSFDSMSNTDDMYDTDFCTQQSGATMYLYNCFCKGYSYKNIYAIDGSTIYVSNCIYDTTDGNGTINYIV